MRHQAEPFAFEIRRADSNVPVIFISAESEEIDTVVGLELGPDDFVVKPFAFQNRSASSHKEPHADRCTKDSDGHAKRRAHRPDGVLNGCFLILLPFKSDYISQQACRPKS